MQQGVQYSSPNGTTEYLIRLEAFETNGLTQYHRQQKKQRTGSGKNSATVFHVTSHKRLEKDVSQGSRPASRKRGGPKTTWLDDITEWTEMTLERATRATENPTERKRTTRGQCNFRYEN